MASSRAFVRRPRLGLPTFLDRQWTHLALPRKEVASGGIDWEGYAASYDALTWANPAYRALVERVATSLDRLDLPNDAFVADLGCGTGTFTRLLLDRAPRGRVYALDRSPEFLALLDAKLGANLAVRPLRFDMDVDALPAQNLDAVVAVHVLCHANRPGDVLKRVHDSLRPGGAFIVADIGRPLDLAEWSKIVISDLASRYSEAGWGPLGMLPALGFALQHRGAAKENRRFARLQKDGLVWTHTAGQFADSLREAGFEILEVDGREFRGIDSFAVARRPRASL